MNVLNALNDPNVFNEINQRNHLLMPARAIRKIVCPPTPPGGQIYEEKIFFRHLAGLPFDCTLFINFLPSWHLDLLPR